jgi:zinc protease
VFVGAYVLGLRAKESIQTAGISALLVRTAIRGAAGLTSEQIALAAETLGGVVVPSVSLDVVGWGITVRAEALAEAVELLYRVALEATLDREDLRVERALQASDAARQRDDMYGYPIRRVLAQSFPDSAYGLPILGDPEGVNGLDDALVHEWASQLRSRRMTVVAVGDLEAQAMLDCLGGRERGFERWPASAVDQEKRLNVRWDPGRGREKRDKSQSAIAMAFRTNPYGSPDRFPLIVTGSLLTGLAGRLFEELRERRSLAYTVSAMPWLKRDVGAVLAYIATSPEREEEARSAMLEELASAGAKPIPESEIERATNYAAGALQLRLQSAHAVAGEILEAWIHGGLSSLPSLAEDLRSVTSDDVRRVAGDVFGAEDRAEYVVEGKAVGR